MLVTSIFSFSHNIFKCHPFSQLWKARIVWWRDNSAFKSFPNNNNLDIPKSEAFADDKPNVAQLTILSLWNDWIHCINRFPAYFAFSNNVFIGFFPYGRENPGLYGQDQTSFFMLPHWKIGGMLLFCCPSVCLFIRLSVCTKLTWKLNIFILLINYFTYKALILVKRRIMKTHLLESRSSAKVKVKYQGHTHTKKRLLCFTNKSCFILCPFCQIGMLGLNYNSLTL